MKINKLIAVLVMSTLGMQLGFSQQLPVYNNYVQNPYIYNPARAGSEVEAMNLNLGFRKQYDRAPYGPITGYATFDGRIKTSNVGIGVTVFHDRNGNLLQNSGGQLTYAYHIPFKKDKSHELSIGIGAGVYHQKFNGSAAFTTDPEYAVNDKNASFDLNLGLNYHFKGLNVGFSVPQVLDSKIKFRTASNPNGSNQYRMRREYLVTASYKAQFGGKTKNNWYVEPVVLFRAYKSLQPQLDLSVYAGYKKLVWLGFGYRTGGGFKPENGSTSRSFITPNGAGFHVTGGAGIKERVNVTYTFEMPLNKGNAGELGYTHEVTLNFKLHKKVDQADYDKNKKKTDDAIAEVKGKTDGLAAKVDESVAKTDSLANNLDSKLGNDLTDNSSKIESLSKEVDRINTRLDNVVFKKFGSVYFELDKSNLTPEAQASLDAFKSKLAGMKGNYFIYLAGNASQEASAAYNQELSAKRCNQVKTFLEGVGISQRILILPYGENIPVTSSQNDETDRAKNRRVDIYLAGE